MAPPGAEENRGQPPPVSPPQANGEVQGNSGHVQNVSVPPIRSCSPIERSKLGKGLPDLPPDPKTDPLGVALWTRRSIRWSQALPVSCEDFVHMLQQAKAFVHADRVLTWFKDAQEANSGNEDWDAWGETARKLMEFLNGHGYQGRLMVKMADMKQADDEDMVLFLAGYRDVFTAVFPDLSLDRILVTDLLSKLNPYARSYLRAYLEAQGYPSSPDIEDIFAELERRAEVIKNKTYATGFEPNTAPDPCFAVAQVSPLGKGKARRYQGQSKAPNQRTTPGYNSTRVPKQQNKGGPWRHKPARSGGWDQEHSYGIPAFRHRGGRNPGPGHDRGPNRRYGRGGGGHPSRNFGNRGNNYQNSFGTPPQHFAPQGGYGNPQHFVNQVAPLMPMPVQGQQVLQQPVQGYYQNFQ